MRLQRDKTKQTLKSKREMNQNAVNNDLQQKKSKTFSRHISHFILRDKCTQQHVHFYMGNRINRVRTHMKMRKWYGNEIKNFPFLYPPTTNQHFIYSMQKKKSDVLNKNNWGKGCSEQVLD